MKKVFTILFAAALMLSLAACGGSSGSGGSSGDSSDSSTTSPYDAETQRNINSIADAYDTDPKNIEDSINRILND